MVVQKLFAKYFTQKSVFPYPNGDYVRIYYGRAIVLIYNSTQGCFHLDFGVEYKTFRPKDKEAFIITFSQLIERLDLCLNW